MTGDDYRRELAAGPRRTYRVLFGALFALGAGAMLALYWDGGAIEYVVLGAGLLGVFVVVHAINRLDTRAAGLAAARRKGRTPQP